LTQSKKKIGETKNVLDGYSKRESNEGNHSGFLDGALCFAVAKTDKVEFGREASLKQRGFFCCLHHDR